MVKVRSNRSRGTNDEAASEKRLAEKRLLDIGEKRIND